MDQVDGLGHFIEFEAVVDDSDRGLSVAEKKVTTLRQAFGVEDTSILGGSYSDLALAERGG